MDPAPFLRGNVFPSTRSVPYPRAKRDDRLPGDTWRMASIPVGVRLELVGDADAIEIEYRTETDDLGYRGDGAGRTFAAYRGGELVAEDKAELGEGRARLDVGPSNDERTIVYLPEGMRPTVVSVDEVGGSLEPAPPQPKWIAYGDSIAEGWVASAPAYAWPAIAGRTHGLDVANLGYAGAARGEIVSAEHVADLDADVISITHGTNCWTRTPHSTDMMRAAVAAFIAVVRQGHPDTPIVVASPVVRPDAEQTPNRLGASLHDLRGAMEDVVRDRITGGDGHLTLVEGAPLLTADHLADGIHPGDEGHQRLADAIGGAVAGAVRTR